MKSFVPQRCLLAILLFATLSSNPSNGQSQKVYTDILFEKHFFSHLEAEYIFRHINTFRFFEYAWVQPSQLSISGQKEFTFFKVAQIGQKNVSAVYDLMKIAYAQSDFYFSELASYHLANYYFEQKNFTKCLEFIQMTSPFSSNNTEWKSLMYKKAYCLYKTEQYLPAYQLFSSLNTMNEVGETPFGLFYEGYLSYLIGNYRNTVIKMQRVEKTSPFNQVAPILIVQAYAQDQHYDSIIRYSRASNFSPVVKDTVNFRTWHTILAYSFFRQKQYQEAIQHFHPLSLDTAKDENSLQLLYAYAFSLQSEKEYTPAITYLEHLFQYSNEDNPLHEESAFLLADLYLKNTQKEEARKLLGSIGSHMKDSLKSIQASIQYAKISLELGYVNDALRTLEGLSNRQLSSKKREVEDLRVQALAISKDYATAYQLLTEIDQPSENLQKLVPNVLYAYGLLQLKINDYQMADSLLSEVRRNKFASDRMKHEVYFWKAEIAIIRSQYPQAISFLDQYEDQISDRDNQDQLRKFSYNYGFSYMKAEKFEDALQYFNKALYQLNVADEADTEEWMVDAMVYQADCHLMLKHYAKAYADYDKIIKIAPRYADYAYFQNCQIVGFQDPKEKERRLDLFVNYYPQSPYLYRVFMEKADLAMNDRRYEKAIQSLEELLRFRKDGDTAVQTNQTDILLKLALAYYNYHQYDKSSEVYKTIITDYPNTEASQEALRNLKTIAVESNKVGELRAFMEVTDMGMDELDSLEFSSVRKLVIDGASKLEVREATEKYLEKNPTGRYVARANHILAEQFTQEGDWEKALSYYEQVVKLSFNDFTEASYVSMAKIAYFELKDYTRAEQYFQKIVEISQNTFHTQDALRGLLRIYYYTKNWGMGYRIAKQIESLPTNVSDDIELAQIIYAKNFQMEKKYQEAISRYALVAKKSYYYPEAQYEIARCYLKMENLAKAKEVALAITKINTPNTFFYSKSYFILGEIFMQEKDYFNAKATFESLVKHAKSAEIRDEASEKLSEISVLGDM